MNDKKNKKDSTPDNILKKIYEEEINSKRGKLKIFFGSCAGVGKTYAMLLAAHQLIAEGIDVMVGIIETHGRLDTEKLLIGLPQIPLFETVYKGVKLYELNLNECLSRKPDIVLVDELAHTNAPGLRHPKRWNDVMELLDSGINVYTTLNVQHLESLSDLITKSTGITVKETIPDSVFDAAEDIVLFDINVDELLKRLREGKIYIQQETRINAENNFFRKVNLIALREIALRRTAQRIDRELDQFDKVNLNEKSLPIQEKLIVCISPDVLSAKLIRKAKILASALKAPWIAIYIESSRHYRLNEKGIKILEANFRLVERIGGKVHILQGDNVADEIVNYANVHNYSKIVIGKKYKNKIKSFFLRSLCDRLLRRCSDIDIIVVPEVEKVFFESIYKKFIINKFYFKNYGNAFFTLFFLTISGLILNTVLLSIDQALIYLTGVVFVAAKCGLGPAFLYAIFSVSFLHFFFIEPSYSFSIYDTSYFTTFLVMLLTGFVIANQASRLRMQNILARKREQSTQTLYELTKELARTRGKENIARVTAIQLTIMLNINSTIWLQNNLNILNSVYGNLPEENLTKENGALNWCFNNKKIAGRATDTMPTAQGLYFPLVSYNKAIGVLGIYPKNQNINFTFTNEEIELIETITNLLTSSLERSTS